MPILKKDEQQLKAFASIEESLGIVSVINKMIDNDGTFQISFSPKEGRPMKVDVNETENAKIISIILTQKARLAKDISTKAAKYGVILDDEEKASIESNNKKSSKKDTPAAIEPESDVKEKDTEDQISEDVPVSTLDNSKTESSENPIKSAITDNAEKVQPLKTSPGIGTPPSTSPSTSKWMPSSFRTSSPLINHN